MRAVLCTSYGKPEVLQLGDVEIPTPKAKGVLIRVRAATVSSGDVKIRSFAVSKREWLFARLYLGLLKPRNAILVMELAGEIEAVGKDVTQYEVGDRVFGATIWSGFGGYAEYNCMPEDTALEVIPANLSYQDAAPVAGGGLTAQIILEKANIQSGQQVLIYGASGSVGSYAVQLARNLGAHVTGVCSSTNLELVESLGAEKVIDYTRKDFTASGKTYDVIFDAVDKLQPSHGEKALKKTGIYLNVVTSTGGGGTGREHSKRLADLACLLESGTLRTVVDRNYPLENIVEAHRYVEKGHKTENVVIPLR